MVTIFTSNCVETEHRLLGTPSAKTRLFLQAREPVEAIKSLAPRRQPGQRPGRLHNIFFKRKQKTGRLDMQLGIRWTWSLRNVGVCRTTRISAWSLGMDRSPRLSETRE